MKENALAILEVVRRFNGYIVPNDINSYNLDDIEIVYHENGTLLKLEDDSIYPIPDETTTIKFTKSEEYLENNGLSHEYILVIIDKEKDHVYITKKSTKKTKVLDNKVEIQKEKDTTSLFLIKNYGISFAHNHEASYESENLKENLECEGACKHIKNSKLYESIYSLVSSIEKNATISKSKRK